MLPKDSRLPISPIASFFRPKAVAVLGATDRPRSVGRAVLANLKQTPFGGSLYAVNPNHAEILGVPCFRAIKEAPEPIDLAVIVTRASTVPGVVRECAEAGVRAAVIISAGFKESGAAGLTLEQDTLREARRTGMRLIGPNCLGVMCPITGLNATFAPSMAQIGHIGLISQSGAICTAILDWSLRENVGFSAFLSVGSMIDVEWGELIQYLGDDPSTRSIVIYMESVPDARKFLSAAREVALTKPIIVLKPGRTKAAAKAAASHTGALTGSDDVLDAAFRRCGILRVNTIDELFNLSEVLGKQPRPRGPHLSIVTNAGGAAVLAADALILAGGQMAELAPKTIETLDTVLPAHWSHQNPVDILGDADADRYAKAVEVVANDPSTDGLLMILSPQAMTTPLQVAEAAAASVATLTKPVLASWMGGQEVAAGIARLNKLGIPTFDYPDSAARAFHSMWQFSVNLDALYETPQELEWEDPETIAHADARAHASAIVEAARTRNRTILTEFESKAVLAAYGIPTIETRVAITALDAAEIAKQIGYPVALKLHSETITHKTDVGGVRLNLSSEDAVLDAYCGIKAGVGAADFLGVTVQPMARLDGYELILGSSVDAQFGPVLLFGSGGQLVEVYRDRAVGLPPLNSTLARRLMEQTKVLTALKGVRGRSAVDLSALERLLVRFSYLVIEQPWIKEIDINPLLASPERLLALDARMILHGAEVTESPRPAIRPYPSQYISKWTMPDGSEVLMRPIRPEDEPRMVQFERRLSERSVHLRYFHAVGIDERISHDQLRKICFIDYDREIVVIAEHGGAIIGLGWMMKEHFLDQAQLAVLIADEFQGRGLGTEIWKHLIATARSERVGRLTAATLLENQRMFEICTLVGFKQERVDEGIVHWSLTLTGS